MRNNTFCPAITAGTVSYAQVSYSITVLTAVTHRRTAVLVLRKPTHYLALQVTAEQPALACCQSFFLNVGVPPPQEKQVYKPRFVQLVLCEVPHSHKIHVECRGFIHRLSQTHGR